MKRLLAALGLLGLALALLAGVLVARALSMRSTLPAVPASTLPVDRDRVAARLGQAVAFRTVSAPAQRDDAQFAAMQAWMAETWPSLHRVAPPLALGHQALLYTWVGSDPRLAPVVIMAHQDVVPVEAGTEGDWTRPPFEGAIAPCDDIPGDCVWGRGTMDMKATLVGLFEAADALAASGWTPRRTLLFALGDDEEVDGTGARAIVGHLSAGGIRPAWVLDEGLVITDGILPGLDRPAALVALSEKGVMNVELIARSEGGHSSMPPPSTAAGRLAAALTRLEAAPSPPGLDGPAGMMFTALGPFLPLGQRVVFSNTWLFSPIVLKLLEAKANTAALVRTTQAITMLEGSPQANVLPQQARAVVNYRLHPRDSIAGVLARIAAVVDDPEIEVRVMAGGMASEPSPVSPMDAPGYAAIQSAILAAAPGVAVAPGLMVGATDARFFTELTDAVYRFHPLWLRPGDSDRIHATDERVAVDNLVHFVRFHDAHLRLAGGG